MVKRYKEHCKIVMTIGQTKVVKSGAAETPEQAKVLFDQAFNQKYDQGGN